MFWKSSMQRYKFRNTLQHNRKPCHDGGCFFLRFSHFPVHLVVNYSTLLLSHSLSATKYAMQAPLVSNSLSLGVPVPQLLIIICIVHLFTKFTSLFVVLYCFLYVLYVLFFFHWWMLHDRWHGYGSTGGNIDPL